MILLLAAFALGSQLWASSALAIAPSASTACQDTAAVDQASAPASGDTDTDTDAAPMTFVLEWLRTERDRLAADLARAHSLLLARATVEDPALAKRLTPEPAKPLRRGYGVVPEVRDSAPYRTLEPTERVYSLEAVTASFNLAFRDASILAQRAERDKDLALGWAVSDYERVAGRMKGLDEQLAYHEFWQGRVQIERSIFDARNEIVVVARDLRRLRKSGTEPERLGALEYELRERVAPFSATPGLAITADEDGARTMRIEIATDIVDDALLEAFQRGIREEWSESDAAKAAPMRFEVEFERHAPSMLYPDGLPSDEEPLAIDAHLERFPAGRLVLTTGADNLHSIVGKYIQLGAKPVTPRVLAHEFGHLLGFQDAYLRGYDGLPSDRFGVKLVEWTGLTDDLMGGPGVGRVTTPMIQELLDAYAD